MPELPDITVYVEALAIACGRRSAWSEPASPSRSCFARSTRPLRRRKEKLVKGVRRMGKRIVLELEDDLLLVIHLMIAGRLRWLPAGAKVPGKIGLAAFDFSNGTPDSHRSRLEAAGLALARPR